MIDPLERWAQYGEKPDYAGLLTFAGQPFTEDPAELAGFDVAIVGAPMDDLVSDRPGARLAPRAIRAASCPPARTSRRGVDAFAALRVVDFGDAPVIPADPDVSHAAIEATVAQVLAAGALPAVLGGDHSVTEPAIRACAANATGPSASCTSTPTPTPAPRCSASRARTGRSCAGSSRPAHVDGRRYAQIGLRGYWPGERELAWQAEHGVTSLFMHDVRDLGIREVVRRAAAAVGAGPVYLTVDVDVLDPAFVPGTGTPEPGGMTAVDLLLAVRTVAASSTSSAPTSSRSSRLGRLQRRHSALVAERVIREALTGIALRRG